MSTKRIKWLVLPCSIGVVLCLLFFWRDAQPSDSTPKAPPASEKRATPSPVPRPSLLPTQETLSDFQRTAFYRTIIDNNLFRPLGWTPPRTIEPYRLLGTILPTDGHTPPQAILQTTRGLQTHIVTIGEKLSAETEIVDIQPKQVTLETNRQQRTLRLNTVFLKPHHSPPIPKQRHPWKTP